MDFATAFTSINFWAVIVAAASAMLVGSFWYSPLLFGKTWMRENGFSEKDLTQGLPMWIIFTNTFLLSFISAIAIAMFLGPESNAVFGATAGSMIAIFWITTSKAHAVLYEQQSLKLFLIHAGFDLVAYMIMGAIVGAWH